MADFPVKWFSNDMGGSPANGDEYGALVELLKACLVTGFNTKPITSLTYDSATQQATASVGSGHGYLKWQVIAISGADQAGYNGEHRVTAIGSDWVRFALDAAPAAAEATGELIEIKTPPVGGWEVVAEDADTHRAAFRRTDVTATDLTLIVRNDTHTNYPDTTSASRVAQVAWVEDFTDLDTFGSENVQFWPFSDYYLTSLRFDPDWKIVANSKFIYYVNRYGYDGGYGLMFAGDIPSFRPADSYNCIVNGIYGRDNWNSSSRSIYPYSWKFGYTNFFTISRANHQLPGVEACSLVGVGQSPGTTFDYPNPSDNGLHISLGKIIVREGKGGFAQTSYIKEQAARGYLPGLYQSLNASDVYHGSIIDHIPGLDGDPVLMIMTAADEKNYMSGLVAISLADWE
ncbi:hypothetical protein [Cobetia sp. 5-25-4-2]|uniref:hypothetical protein n=1 Tax=Cobetia sp. 5-25-4-2 TaxID=2737459 RepID=UPI0015968F13|nr:hypothetical protein [Cobetia sp. 5-25-4-2]